jgi:hypothetical protein
MLAIYLWAMGSVILVILGTIHLFYTFFSNKFSSKNKDVISEMKHSSPIITNETTIWKAWIGFNASHSSGAIFIGVLNLFLAIKYFDTFKDEHFFFIFNIVTITFYVWLAKTYWFKIPFLGISISLICYISSYCLVLYS